MIYKLKTIFYNKELIKENLKNYKAQQNNKFQMKNLKKKIIRIN
jgi:hypothetical protein